MEKDALVFLLHIWDSISRIEEYTKDMEYRDFINSNLVQAGVIREIEIIGEATKRLSQDFKENRKRKRLIPCFFQQTQPAGKKNITNPIMPTISLTIECLKALLGKLFHSSLFNSDITNDG